MERIHSGRFEIEKSPAKPVSLELRPRTFKFACLLACIAWLLYFGCELVVIGFSPLGASKCSWCVWVILLSEFALQFQELVLTFNILLGLFTPGRKPARSSYRLIGQSAPSIDILVTCCGEPLDVILDTVRAAATQDYPIGDFRVFVLDDGHDHDLSREISDMAYGQSRKGGYQAEVRYLSRALSPGTKSFFKAGNLNFGIDETSRLGHSEFLAGLDADMIPENDWLRKMVPHLILSDSVGIAVGPQVGRDLEMRRVLPMVTFSAT